MNEQVTGLIDGMGYAGIALLMLLENVFPPIPSELVMPLAGYTASIGEMNVTGALLAGTAGSVAGAWFWYWLAKSVGEGRLKHWARQHGRWLSMTPHDVEKLDGWFKRYSKRMVFFGRLVPTVRTLVSIPAGVFGMRNAPFLLLTTAGSFLWNAALTGAGWWLGENHALIGEYLGPVSLAIVLGAALWYLYRVATFDPDKG